MCQLAINQIPLMGLAQTAEAPKMFKCYVLGLVW